jgi:hypothetical protein
MSDVAEQLLDAQVRHVLDELTAARLSAVIADATDDVLATLGPHPVAELVGREPIKVIGRRLVAESGGSSVVTEMADALSDGIYDLGASDEYLLGEVLDRDAVLALVRHALTLHRLADRLLDRLTESPLVATVASAFVAKIVGDFMQQNRAMAEKLPGMSTMLNIGAGAASRVRGVTDRHLDQLLGDAAGKGAMYALKRTNNALRELLREAPLEQAALELWDLHAAEPIGDLRAYLTRDELRELVARVVAVVVAARDTEYAGHLVDACVDVFFDSYGQHTLAELLDDLGVTRDAVVADLVELLPPLVELARQDGRLEAAVRARLEPFYRSAAVTDILRSAAKN